MKKNTELTGVIYVLIAATTWGCIGLFTRYLSAHGMSSMAIALMRSSCAAIILGSYLAVTQREVFRIEPKDIWMFFGTGLVSIAAFNVFYFYTQTVTTLSIAAVLLYTAPFFVIFMSAVFFKDPITKQKMMAVLLAFGGCLFVTGVVGGKVELMPIAIVTGLGSAISYALYSIFSTVALKKYQPMTVTFYSLFISACGLAVVVPASGTPLAPLNAQTIICGLLFGLISTTIPYVFYTKGLKLLVASKASVLAFAEPMVATILGFAVMGEAITLNSIIGIGLILAGIIVLNKKH